MTLNRISSMLVALLFVGASLAQVQGTFDDGFGFNVTKLSDEITRAIRTELQALTLTPIAVLHALRDDLRALDHRLSKLGNDSARLAAQHHAFSTRFETLLTSRVDAQTITLASAFADNTYGTGAMPPVLRVGTTNLTYALVGPEATLAHLLAASHLLGRASASNESGTLLARTQQQQRQQSDQTILALTSASPAPAHPPPIHDWRELALFWAMLSLVTLYLVVLVFTFFQKTAQAQLRGEEKPATKNAAIASWWRHREMERREKAAAEAARQKAVEQRRLAAAGAGAGAGAGEG